MNSRNQLGGRGTGQLAKRMLEISSAFSKKTQEDLGNSDRDKTTGLVGSRSEIGEDAKNQGLSLGNETVKKEPSQVTCAPSLAAVKEMPQKRVW